MRSTLTLLLALAPACAALLACGGDDTSARDGGADAGDAGTTDSRATGDTNMPIVDGGAACIGCGPCLDDTFETTAFEQTLIELPGNTWYEAPGSTMRAVCVDDSVGVRGVVGCPAAISAWSSGAYDSGRRRMLIWGGGHDDYWGNELYAFDLVNGAWARVTDPSTIPEGADPNEWLSQDPLPDGRPVSRHSYDGVEYLADLDLLWGHGGSRARDGSSTSANWFFEAVSSTWSTRAEGPGGLSNASAYDETGGVIWVKRSESLHFYDVATDTWTDVDGFGTPPLWPRYANGGDKTAAIDPSRRLLWSVGSGEVMVWDVVENAAATDAWATTGGGDYSNADGAGSREGQLFESGGGDVYDTPGPGFDYDRATDSFVAWPNRGAPLALDLESKTWSYGSADGAPVSENSGGTYGRFRYVDAYNVFILVNSVDENVYFYKHTAGCGG